jgi:RimJ/RimL family protein N-acetyltransferase
MSLATLSAQLTFSAAAFDAGVAWTFSIFDSDQTRVLGAAGLERAEDALIRLVGARTVETGYWLRADATGHGYATEATGCLVQLAFTQLRVERVVVCHHPANVASEGVPRRLGFRCIGVVRDSVLPGRLAADGSVRPETKIWVLEKNSREPDSNT